MIYFAHRGSNTKRVQNTVEAFSLAREQGATHYELDVHLLKDGALAIHHDYSLLSTTGVDVYLKDLTAADLNKYPLQNPFTQQRVYVALLTDVLAELVPSFTLLNIELKNDGNIYPGLEKAVLNALPAEILPRVLFSSFDYASLQRMRAFMPSARIGLLTRQFNMHQALEVRAESVHINHIRFTPDIATSCHAQGLKLYCYTLL